MKREARHIRKQSGVALIAFLVLLIMAGAYAFYRSTSANYQISDATLSAAPGRLTINQTGNYRVVVINAGRALSGQNRNSRSAANYFEDINSDASRNGDAAAPASTFANIPVSGTFNDRLAY